MMALSTQYTGFEGGKHRVQWFAGLKKMGVALINDVGVMEDADIAAELICICHLIFKTNIFQRICIMSGEGIALKTASGAIKKLYLKKSTKTHLYELAEFLSIRLKGMEINVTSKPVEEIFNRYDGSETVINIDAYDKTWEIFDFPAIGKILLTQHAIDQFLERLNSGKPKNPLASLTSALSHPDLKLQKLPENVAQHKARKYGENAINETWGHDHSLIHFTVVRDLATNIGKIVTVYAR